jgi:hypothetical protein
VCALARNTKWLVDLTITQHTHTVLLEAGIIHVVIYRILSSIFLDDVLGACSRILYHFAQSKEMRSALIKTQVVCAAVVLLRRVAAAEHQRRDGNGKGRAAALETMLASLLERLSWPPASQHRIVEDGGMLALVDLVRRRHDPQSPLDVKVRLRLVLIEGRRGRC